jgi:hypothetical protein
LLTADGVGQITEPGAVWAQRLSAVAAKRTYASAPTPRTTRTASSPLSPNIEKFGHGLRDFRNYVHPAEQLARGFSRDQNTARIGFQVVIAAADDLVRAAGTEKDVRS